MLFAVAVKILSDSILSGVKPLGVTGILGRCSSQKKSARRQTSHSRIRKMQLAHLELAQLGDTVRDFVPKLEDLLTSFQ